ncbi:uncharacterized protein LOC119651597 isoform X2 [Hermetia illucens]|uniref:uncharacterized protein LOC119651597 isoform X2 n=1 Tax=Hermetia illucens TaxID=343691 RepID=UPI0018CBFA57|nr:uncharacterized protein LOC119651597 isoform X2 [Hermetia illucens]
MDPNYVSIAQKIEPSEVEKKIEEYLQRGTPRDAKLVKSAKTVINSKSLIHPDMDYGDSLRQFTSESADDVRRILKESDSDTAKDLINSCDQNSTLIDRYTRVVKENEALKKDLEKRELELNALGPRYKYMEKHFEDFIRLKEEYERLKEDKIREGKIVDTRNKSQQTWASSIICDTCVKTLDVIQSPDFQHYVSSRREDSFCVTKSELLELEEKFKALKDTISEREREYENRFEKAEIIHLTALNCKYRSQLQDLHRKNKQNHNWANALQKIIAKLCARDELGDLTEQEHGWVDRIVDKYLSIEEASREQPEFEASGSHDSLPTSDHPSEDRQ